MQRPQKRKQKLQITTIVQMNYYGLFKSKELLPMEMVLPNVPPQKSMPVLIIHTGNYRIKVLLKAGIVLPHLLQQSYIVAPKFFKHYISLLHYLAVRQDNFHNDQCIDITKDSLSITATREPFVFNPPLNN